MLDSDNLVLSLATVTTIDYVGLTALREFVKSKRNIYIVGASTNIKKLLSEFDNLKFYATIVDAVKASKDMCNMSEKEK